MTYFSELAAAVSRNPKVRSGELVFQGTRVPVDALLDSLAKGKDAETFVAGHPTVPAQEARVVARAWEDIRRDADEEEARGRLLAHADWALISQRVARRIDAQRDRSPRRPDLETLPAWADAVARELGGDPTPAHRPREDRRLGPGGEVPMGRAREVEVRRKRLIVRLTDGREVSVPIEWFSRLERAAPDERENWALIGDGEGIHWPDVDEDVAVHSLLRPEETIPSREIREGNRPEETDDDGHTGGELRGWDDGKIYVYFDRGDPLRPISGYCVSHDPDLIERLLELCREHLQRRSLDELPPRPGPGDMTPWPPPGGAQKD